MGSLQDLGDGKWRVRVDDPYRPVGSRKQVSRTFTANGRRAADRKRPSVESALLTSMRRDASERAASGSIAELAEEWLQIKSRDLSPSTLLAYRRRAGLIVERLGGMQVIDLAGRDIDRWYGELMDSGYSPANIHSLHRVLRALLNFGRKKRRMHTTALDEVNLPKHRPAEITPPTPQALQVLLSTVTGEWGRAVRLLATTGLRRGEVVGLAWVDIDGTAATVQRSVLDMPGGKIHVKEPKGRRSRTIGLTGSALVVLAEQAEFQRPIGSTPWVFADWKRDTSGRTPRRPGWVSLMWGRHRAKHGARSVRLHDLRHWFATEALGSGIPAATVSAQLGHAQTSTTTDIYGHGTDASKAVMLDAIDRALGVGPDA